jgi:hypothetical protein
MVALVIVTVSSNYALFIRFAYVSFIRLGNILCYFS